MIDKACDGQAQSSMKEAGLCWQLQCLHVDAV